MSNILIARMVEITLKERTTVYSPLVEAIVNSIEAIQENKRTDGKITITPIRNPQGSLDLDSKELPDIIGFIVEDNGIGFNKDNRDAFDTLCTDYKIDQGGKGLGRFIFLKYYKKVRYKSIYKHNDQYHLREFNLGSKNEIIENEKDREIKATDVKTTLLLEGLINHDYDKQLDTLARKILEKILVFFINEDYQCPTIILKENDESIILNDLLKNSNEIKQIYRDKFSLIGENISDNGEFQMVIYKIIYPGNITSKICLTAQNRLVTESPLHKYIPEFKDNFYETIDGVDKNYIITAYILGRYLDKNVSLERSKFNFPEEKADGLYPITQHDIEKEASKITADIFKNEVQVRRDKKIETIKKYVDESAPWHKTNIKDIDYETLPYELDDQTMEAALQKAKFNKEQIAKTELNKIIDNPKTELFAKADELVKSIQEAQSSDLTHYVALRKIVLDLLKELLNIKDDEKYHKEAEIHNIIFPMKKDSETIPYEMNNLWILDEKLNFTELISSDKLINKKGGNRPDLLIFNNKMVYRGGDEKCNPITIFEFKQPQRDDFTDRSKEEDPVDQIIRYVSEIKLGKYKTPKGRDIVVGEDTPFYSYLVCDLTQKVRNWATKEEFTTMPDGKGYFKWFTNNRIYMEVLSWDKVLKDAEQRNKIFFRKLGIA